MAGSFYGETNIEDVTTTTGRNTQVTLQEAGTLEEFLRNLGVDLSKLQLGNVQSQSAMQELLNQQTRDLFSPSAMAAVEERAGQAGRLSPDEENIIRQIEEQSLAFGESDINRYTQEGLDMLKQQAAPSRGLRFGDTPILDRGGQLVGEGIRQKAQLQRDVLGRGAQQRLDYPIQRQGFQEMLRENARRFRLGLAGTTAQAGLGLAGLFDPYGQQKLFLTERLAQPQTSTQEKVDERTYKQKLGGGMGPGGGGGGLGGGGF